MIRRVILFRFGLCVDYLRSASVVLLRRLLSSVYPDLLCWLSYSHMRRPNALNLDVNATAMPRPDLIWLLTHCRMRRPNALNLDVIATASCRDFGQ